MCGIAGFFGVPGKESLFNFTGFCHIFIAQDSRGGDSMGVAYGVAKENARYAITWGSKDDKIDRSKVSSFMQHRGEEFNPKNFRTPHVILAHARKASASVSTNRDGAHPFHYGNIIGVHNGIIRNYKEMAELFKVDIKGIDVDSEAMYKILSEGHLDALKIYEGDAALVWVDKNTDDVYVWVGAGKKWNTVKQDYEPDYERTLHYLSTEAGIYISSEFGPLELFKGITECDGKVYHFNSNSVTHIKDGKIVQSFPVVRAKLVDYMKENGLLPKIEERKETVSTPPLPLVIEERGEEKGIKKLWPSPACIEGIRNLHYSYSSADEISLYYGLYESNGVLLHNIVKINYDDNNIPYPTWAPFTKSSAFYYHGIRVKSGKEREFIAMLYAGRFTDLDAAKLAFNPIPSGWSDFVKSATDFSKNDPVTKIHYTKIKVDKWLSDLRPTVGDTKVYFIFDDDSSYIEPKLNFVYPEVQTAYIFNYGECVGEERYKVTV